VAETADVRDFDLIDAWIAIPVAVAFGVLALVLARRGRRRAARTVSRRGDRWARVGRALGALALALAAASGIALAFYWYLDHIGA
jgi:UDP-N-acetylmuramyl pentapeptide phosphotransferase/UDP-N-acetylglucosamine-1-phosphate transferase